MKIRNLFKRKQTNTIDKNTNELSSEAKATTYFKNKSTSAKIEKHKDGIAPKKPIPKNHK